MIAIESKEGVTLYGKIIDQKTKRLGRFEVYSNDFGNSGAEYMRYPEAQGRFNSLVNAASNSGEDQTKKKYGKKQTRQHREHNKARS